MSEDFELDEGGYDSQDETPAEQVESGYNSADDNGDEGDDTFDETEGGDLEIPEGVTMDPSSFIDVAALDAQIRAQRGEVPQSLPAAVTTEVKQQAPAAPVSQLSFLQPPQVVRSPVQQPQQQVVQQQYQQPQQVVQQQFQQPQQVVQQQTYAPGAGQQTYATGSQPQQQQTYGLGPGQQQQAYASQPMYMQAPQQSFVAPEVKETHRAVMPSMTTRPVDSVPINYQVFGTRVLTGLLAAKVPLQPDALRRGVYTVAGMASLGNVYDRTRAVDAMNSVGRF